MGPGLHSRLRLRSLWPSATHSLQGPSSAPPSTCHLSSPSQCTATTPSHLWLRPRNDFSEILPPLPMSQQQRTCRVLPLSPRPSLSNPICLDYEFQCAFSEASPDSQELETQRRTALRSVLPAGKSTQTHHRDQALKDI